MTEKYSVEKVMVDLSNQIPLYEYKLVNEFGLCVATICCEDLALRIKEALNNE